MSTDEMRDRCARCGAPFHCGMNDPGGCWCAQLPPLPAERLQAMQGCLCPDCLRAATASASPPGAA
jgi:DNA-directed RNA polymerase subunit RPC12/RpoP